MTIDYLICTYKKTNQEIENIVLDTNLHNASILIGNQCCEIDDERSLVIGDNSVRVVSMISRGVSINRNELLLKATAEYVTFLDDDIYFTKDSQKQIELYSKNNDNAFRVNVVSDNPERPIKQYSIGKLGYYNLRSVGVWGIFYKRNILLNEKFTFDINIGPGASYPSGEDTIFHRNFLKHYKVIQTAISPIHAKQIESTWQGINRDEKRELIGAGYTYSIMFGKLAYPIGIFHILKHKRKYKLNIFKTLIYFSIGVKEQRGNK